MSLYPPPAPIATTLFVDVVAQLGLKPQSSPWLTAFGLGETHSFLEGPSFDADGNLDPTRIPLSFSCDSRPYAAGPTAGRLRCCAETDRHHECRCRGEGSRPR